MRSDPRWRPARGLTLVLAALSMAAGILLSGSSPATGVGESPPPNVVVIQTDDQTLESMRVMKETRAHLAKRGATFRNHYANLPVCCPSRATLLTGQYAHNHGVFANRPPNGGFAAFDDRETLPVWLQRRGYVTAHVGKYLNGYGNPGVRRTERGPVPDETYVPPGWDEWYTAPNQNVYDYELNENGTLVHYGNSEDDFKQDVFSRRAAGLISEHAGSPFYLQVDYTAPHSGGPDPSPRPSGDCNRAAKPAPRHAHKFDGERLPRSPAFDENDVSDKPKPIRRRERLSDGDVAKITRQYECRLESLLSVDEGVARIVRSLAKNGVLDNTYVMFFSDNGYFQGEHRITEGKRRAYEEAAHIPLIVRGPGVPREADVKDMTINADVAPTIMEVTGATAALEPDGRSLLGTLESPALESGRELLIESPKYKAIRTARYLWVEHKNGDRELYDMSRDPFQLESLHDKSRTLRIRERLAARLASLAACAGQSCLSRPELEPELEASEGGSCVEPKVRASFAGADKSEIERAEFFADGKLAKLDRRKPFTYEFTRRDLGRERSTVLLRATLIDGRRASWDARLRLC